jgi:Toxin SymE, type I toxin-antitoxin system
MMQVREKRVGYKVATSKKPVGQRGIQARLPSLDISGAWFANAGFQPGDSVIIEVQEAVIRITKRK